MLLAFGLTRNPQNLPSALIGKEAPEFRLERMESPWGPVQASGETAEGSGIDPALTGDQTQTGDAGRPEGTEYIALADLRGRVVILNFWASWCIPCRAEHPVLVHASETYDPEDVVLLGVLYQDSEENGKRFMREFGGDWPSVLDPNSYTALDYGVYGVPETFFISADGRIVNKQVSPVTWELVSETVASLLEERVEMGLEPGVEPLDRQPEASGR